MKLSLSNLSTLYSWFHNRFMVCLNRKSDLWNFESRKLKEKENKFFFSFFFFKNFCGYVRWTRTLNFLDAVPSPLSELKPPFMRAIWPWWIFDECFDSFDSIEHWIILNYTIAKIKTMSSSWWWINYREKNFFTNIPMLRIKFLFFSFF